MHAGLKNPGTNSHNEPEPSKEESPMIRSPLFQLAAALSTAALLGGAGCASTGSANASAQSATARSGDSKNVTTVSVSLALGDKVAEAASNLIGKLSAGWAGPLTPDARQAAVNQGVQAGLDQAKAEGKTPTEEQKTELVQHCEKKVDELAPKAE